ncbi:MAG: hypothetical protein QGG36_33030 [Pirellulaceae bacterium]|nr:hypothetical protein [Pirellulaceae bacterium]MDP7020657.1 hypothetical protein [Pirellulaceae bacterium]
MAQARRALHPLSWIYIALVVAAFADLNFHWFVTHRSGDIGWPEEVTIRRTVPVAFIDTAAELSTAVVIDATVLVFTLFGSALFVDRRLKAGATFDVRTILLVTAWLGLLLFITQRQLTPSRPGLAWTFEPIEVGYTLVFDLSRYLAYTALLMALLQLGSFGAKNPSPVDSTGPPLFRESQ